MKNKTELLFVFTLCQRILMVESEIFTSIHDLSEAFLYESRVVEALTQYVTKTEARLVEIKSYLRDFGSTKTDAVFLDSLVEESEEQRVERLVGNPINAFHLLKRLARSYRIRTALPTPTDDWAEVELVASQSGNTRLASEEDLQGAASAIIRLQNVYRINISSLASGNILGIQSTAELSAHDCLFIGKRSFVMGLYYDAVEWFNEANRRVQTDAESSVLLPRVTKLMQKALASHRESQESPSVEIKNNTQTNSPNYEMKKGNKIGENLSMVEIFENYEALCRGEILRSEETIATLNCFFDHRDSHYLRLMPAKIEIQHHDPDVIVFHDVLSDNEILHLKKRAKPKLSRGVIRGLPNMTSTTSITRTSKVAWLEPRTGGEDTFMGTIERRIRLLTRLETDLQSGSSELLQMANYGTGGHYSLHFDYLFTDESNLERKFHPIELESGDRIATFMFYASNVIQGGATVFPNLGVAVWPQKGAAAFWYNLKKSGEGDERTLHGACPVVHGSKWVVNKWIREKNQFLNNRCGLDKNERYKEFGSRGKFR